MNEQKTIISLKILILNELLHNNVIDKDTYDQAAKKIIATEHQVA